MEALVILALTAIAIYVVLVKNRAPATRVPEPYPHDLHNELLKMLHGDEIALKRLVMRERRKNPMRSKKQCYEAAIRRLRNEGAHGL